MTSSIVITTYNGERFLEEQLNSIMHQTVLPDEVIISDDGSTDRTEEIAKCFISRYQNAKTQFTFCKNDLASHGVVGNLENGIKKAHGDYVFICDQDDIWHQNKIEKVMEVFSNRKGREKVLIHNARVIREAEDGSFLMTDRWLMPAYPFDSEGLYKPDGKEEMMGASSFCIINGMCICAERKWLLSILPFSRSFMYDLWLLFCAFADDTIIALNEELAYYRIHKDNLCGMAEFLPKKTVRERIRNYDQAGKKSIEAYYIWHRDIKDYLRDKPTDQELSDRIQFFNNERLEAISSKKWKGTCRLRNAYRSGVYRTDGKRLLLHDILFIWGHTEKYRAAFVKNLYESPARI